MCRNSLFLEDHRPVSAALIHEDLLWYLYSSKDFLQFCSNRLYSGVAQWDCFRIEGSIIDYYEYVFVPLCTSFQGASEVYSNPFKGDVDDGVGDERGSSLPRPPLVLLVGIQGRNCTTF